MEKQEIDPKDFAVLARAAGLVLRPGAEAEMAAAYEKLKQLAQLVRSPHPVDSP